MAIDWTPIYKKYKGQWVALKKDEKTVVGNGKTLVAALKKAQAAGYKQPIVFRMPEKIVPFVG